MSKSCLEVFANEIERSNSIIAKSLLSRGEVDANAHLPRETNPPALVHAAAHGRVDIVEQLLNAGAHIDYVDMRGWSACHAAAVRRHTDVLRLLLARGPNLALRDVDGKTALQYAIEKPVWHNGNDNDNAALLLIRAGAPLEHVDRGDLCRLAATSTTAIEVLTSHDVVVGELRDKHGRTPLHWAVHQNAHNSALLSMLVDVCGVDLEARTSSNQRESCIDVAVADCHVAALRLLLLAGADVNSTDVEPLLHKSVKSRGRDCDIMCLMLLLAAGADVAARDRRGRTACHHCTYERDVPMLCAMIAAGADLDAKDDKGNTPPPLRLSRRRATEQIEAARREIAKMRLDFVRNRAMEVCIGLQPLQLDALQMCVILELACGPLARVIAFHQWWKIATTVKHFKL
jgi:ankyrin repeat protein